MAVRTLTSWSAQRLRRALLVALLLATVVTAAAAVLFSTIRSRQVMTTPGTALHQIQDICHQNKPLQFENTRLRIVTPSQPLSATQTDAAQRSARTGRVVVIGGWWGGMGIQGVYTHPTCGTVLISLRRVPLAQARVLTGVLAIFVLAVVVGIPAAHWLSLNPTLRRMEVLRQAAGHIGTSHYALGSAPPRGEPLDDLADALDAAHTRIVADAALLAQRAQVLESRIERMAHDIRTPLSAARLSLEGIEGSRVHRARRELRYIEALVENLLVDARLRSGLLPEATEHFDLSEVTEQATARAAVLGAAEGTQINHAVPDTPVWVIGHWLLAMRAVSNLIDNAVTHGRSGGNVAVILDRRPEGFRLRIIDDGPGFPTHPPQNGRSGLGLPIARAAVKRLGWTLDLQTSAQGTQIEIVGPTQRFRNTQT